MGPDLIFSNEDGMVINIDHLPGIGLSDHICIQFTIQCCNEERREVVKPDYNRADFALIRSRMGDVNWKTLEKADVHDALQLFSNVLQEALKRYVPGCRSPKSKRNMYMAKNTLRMRRRQEKQWKHYLLTGNAHHYALYARTRNALRTTRKPK